MTEKATYEPDLPHAFLRSSRGTNCRVCFGPETGALHAPSLTEQAAHTEPLETEKGT